jgi:chemotaxis protein CheD
MSHFLLPEAGSAPTATRFGDIAMGKLLAELSKLGADVRRLRARVYGGSAPPIADGMNHLGVRNVSQALSFLASKSVPVVDRDVGGSVARKIVFSPTRGTAEVSKIGLA